MSSPHAPQEEDNIIKGELSQVEGAIHQLQWQRVALLRRLNCRQASTRALPSETLSLIFEHVCPPVVFLHSECPEPKHLIERAGTYSALGLGRVSSHWRQVAWSTPQLWTNTAILVGESNVHDAPGILELYLKNVKDLPINLRIGIMDCGTRGLTPLRSIRDILFKDEYSKKIQILQLCNAPSDWLPLSSNFSRLQQISITGSQNRELSFEAVPHLHQLHLGDVHGSVLLPWSSMTRLQLSCVNISTCAKLLTQCPNLIEFRSLHPHDDDEGTPEPNFCHPGPIILHHLQELLWSYHESPWSWDVLQHIQLPNLLKLSWAEGSVDPLHGPEMGELFNELPELLVLELAYITTWTKDTFRDIFYQTGRAQHINLVLFNRLCLYNAFGALHPDEIDDEDGDERIYLPFLTSLTIFGILDGRDNDDGLLCGDFSRRVLAICKARSTRPGAWMSFRLERCGMEWFPEVREELRAMVRGGFQLEFVDMNGRVDWLSDD